MSDLTKLIHDQLWDLVKAKKKAQTELDMGGDDEGEAPSTQGVAAVSRPQYGGTSARRRQNVTGTTSGNLGSATVTGDLHERLNIDAPEVDVGEGRKIKQSVFRTVRKNEQGKHVVTLPDPALRYVFQSALDNRSKTSRGTSTKGSADLFDPDASGRDAQDILSTIDEFKQQNASSAGGRGEGRRYTNKQIAATLLQGFRPKRGGGESVDPVGKVAVHMAGKSRKSPGELVDFAARSASRNMRANMSVGAVSQYFRDNNITPSFNPQTADWEFNFGEDRPTHERNLRNIIRNPQAYLSNNPSGVEIQPTQFGSGRIGGGRVRAFVLETGEELPHVSGTRNPGTTEPTAAEHMTTSAGGTLRDRATAWRARKGPIASIAGTDSRGKSKLGGVPMTASNEILMGGGSTAEVENPNQALGAISQSTARSITDELKDKVVATMKRFYYGKQKQGREEAAEASKQVKLRKLAQAEATRDKLRRESGI